MTLEAKSFSTIIFINASVSLELAEWFDVRGAADLVPALVGEPGGGGVSRLVLQPHPARQEEHELLPVQLLLGSADTREIHAG